MLLGTPEFCFQTNQGHCASCRKKWGLAATDMCPCGKCQTMSHIVNSCPQSKLEGAAAIALSWWRCYRTAEDIRLVNALDSDSNILSSYTANPEGRGVAAFVPGPQCQNHLWAWQLYVVCRDQVQMCQLADQRVVVDQLKQITSTLSNLVGADSTADIRQMTRVDMDRYLSLTQSFSDRSHQIDTVHRQANDVMSPTFVSDTCMT